jgi:ubiquinone/menaquinone biosynthesis C-methylase UbiE
LTCLDLGSGTGRFTPLLAQLFEGTAIGVEPSEKMRAVAQAAPHPAAVEYRAGQAEQIPLPDGACDLALMFLSFHHVRDRAAAAREIARVLAADGRLLVRSVFSDRMPNIGWHRYFPRAREVELEMFPTSDEVQAVFAAQGLRTVALDTVRERFAPNLTEHAAKLRTRSISTFEHLTEAEIEEGFRRLDVAVAQDDGAPIEADCDLLVLERA